MAMEVDTDHPCPHCPSGTSQERHSQDPQLGEVADCDDLDIVSNDIRAAGSKAKDSPEDAPILVHDAYFSNAPRLIPGAYERELPSLTYSSGPPLNLLYCVYLK